MIQVSRAFANIYSKITVLYIKGWTTQDLQNQIYNLESKR